jgi:MFS transporter, CP family, cyanate transporter
MQSAEDVDTPEATARRAASCARTAGTSSGALALLGLVAASAALRPQLSGVGPLLGQIQHSLAISHAVAGLLATIPVACMGLLAIVAPRLRARFGTTTLMTSALVCLTAAGVLRAALPGASTVIALTVVFGIGAGVAGTLLPAIVKARFAANATRITAAYAVALNGAAAVSAAIAAPLAQMVGGWRGTLGVFGAWDLLLTGVWVLTTQGRSGEPAAAAPEQPGSSPRDGAERAADSRRQLWPWVLAIVFGLQATVYFGLNAWLASAYREHGWSQASAGGLVGVLNFVTLPATLAVGALGRRVRSEFRYIAVAAAVLVVATLGIVLAPAGGFAWSVLAGFALGIIFPLCMATTVHLGHDPHDVTRATGVMLGGGYLIAASAPVALGALRDSTGSFTAGIWMLCGVAVVLLVVCGASTRHAGRQGAEATRS